MINEFKRPLSLVEATMAGIRSSIISGQLSLGQQLTEVFLQKTFGFSKTPIREALTQLKAEGLVVAEFNKGFRVFKMDEKELFEFCEYRLALESQAMRTSYKINRLELVNELKNSIKESEESIKSNDLEKYILTDSKFHKSFFLISSNRYLTTSYETINGIIETIRTNSIKTIRTHTGGVIVENIKLIDSVKSHISILKYVEEKNLNMALDELDKHINSWHGDWINISTVGLKIV
jgi:DNA-binding GntR family transcriptional regulator